MHNRKKRLRQGIKLIAMSVVISLGSCLITLSSLASNFESRQPASATEVHFNSDRDYAQQTAEPISFGEAFLSGAISGTIQGVKTGTSYSEALVRISRNVTSELTIAIQRGTILVNVDPSGANWVVDSVKSENNFQSNVISISDDNELELILETFSLDLKNNHSGDSAFYAIDTPRSEISEILESADKLPNITDKVIQAIIFSITEGLNREELNKIGYSISIEQAESLYAAAGIDKEHKRLLKPTCSKIKDCLASAAQYVQLEEYVQALAEYSSVLKSDRDNLSALHGRGHIYLLMHRYEEALADYEVMIRANDEIYIGFFNVGIAYSSMPNPNHELVIFNLTEAINRQPNDAMAHYLRGNSYSALGKNDLAFNDLNKAIILDPNISQAYLARVPLAIERNNIALAIEDLTQLLEKNEKFLEGYRLRGLLFLTVGATAPALNDFKRYLQFEENPVNQMMVESLISDVQGTFIEPKEEVIFSLAEAVERGWVTAEFQSLGMSSGDSVKLTVQRQVPVNLFLSVPIGAVLTSNRDDDSDILLRQVSGLVVDDATLSPTNLISLQADDSVEYFVEAYKIDFNQKTPALGTELELTTVSSPILNAALSSLELFPHLAENIPTIQTVIWSLGSNISEDAIAPSSKQIDLLAIRSILKIVGIDPRCTRFV